MLSADDCRFFIQISFGILFFRANVNDWTANYEKITDMIVPRSSQLITQDADYALFNVTLFKKVGGFHYIAINYVYFNVDIN